MAAQGDEQAVTTLGYALLGLLAREPLSGYALTHVMRDRIGPAWRAGHSQIYPKLARLERRGLLTHELLEHADRPDAKRYSITSAGLHALAAWVTQPAPIPQLRDELLLKVYNAWLANPEDAATLIKAHRDQHAERLALYQGLLDDYLQPSWDHDHQALNSPWFGSIALMRWGLSYEREYVTWCDWLLSTLQPTANRQHD